MNTALRDYLRYLMQQELEADLGAESVKHLEYDEAAKLFALSRDQGDILDRVFNSSIDKFIEIAPRILLGATLDDMTDLRDQLRADLIDACLEYANGLIQVWEWDDLRADVRRVA